MNVTITPHRFTGTVKIPASKSHTIRQLLIASLANGESEIINPLESLDTRSCVTVCKAFGARITEYPDKWIVDGNGGFKKRGIDEAAWMPPDSEYGVFSQKKLLAKNPQGNCQADECPPINNSSQFADRREACGFLADVGNSGTTLYLALAVAALQKTPFTFTGDEQIQRRGAAPLLAALEGLGVHCESNNGCAPITVKGGTWKGGKVVLPCPTSQYLSALLIAAPLAPAGTVTEIEVPLLNEKPYVEMTLSYLKAHGIPYEADFSPEGSGKPSSFIIRGGASWKPFKTPVPGDFSSAAFPAAAAAITGGPVTLLGLDPADTQGDKYFLEMLEIMGCEVEWKKEPDCVSVTISRSKPLKGGVFDLNKTPDLLPAAAAVAAYAQGDTTFVNVAHARIKETDRIAVMAQELAKLGVKCTEKEDGLTVHAAAGRPQETKNGVFSKKKPQANNLHPCGLLAGHDDHRIVMALAVAALGGTTPVEISGAESAAVTYPGFLDLFESLV